MASSAPATTANPLYRAPSPLNPERRISAEAVALPLAAPPGAAQPRADAPQARVDAPQASVDALHQPSADARPQSTSAIAASAEQQPRLPESIGADAARALSAWYEFALHCMVLSMGAYIGMCVRLGYGFYVSGQLSNFTVIYANLWGSLILGYISEFQGAMMAPASPLVTRLWYTFVATGMCGSITTFSTWNLESNKLFLLQLDTSPQSVATNSNASRLQEWLVFLWLGTVLPLAALNAGQHLAQAYVAYCASPPAAAAGALPAKGGSSAAALPPLLSAALVPEWRSGSALAPAPLAVPLPPPSACPTLRQTTQLRLIVMAYVLSTCLVMALPQAYGWFVISWAALCGSAGAVLRWWWAKLYNKGFPRCTSRYAAWASAGADALGWCAPTYPAGTLLANWAGTWLLAAVLVAAKFAVSLHNQQAQMLLFGVAQGFCGCLTTMSTFVLELHRLPRREGYAYGLTSMALAQLGWAVLYDAYASAAATRATATFAVTGPLLSVCDDYSYLCDNLLDTVGCPEGARVANSCGPPPTRSLGNFVGRCQCTSTDAVSGMRTVMDASDFLTEGLMASQMRSLIPSQIVPVWPTAGDGGGASGAAPWDPTSAVDFCLSYQVVCDTVLNRLRCPAELRQLDACERSGLASFKGTCACGGFTRPGLYVGELIVDHLVTRGYEALALYVGPNTPLPIDYCAKFEAACAALLSSVACPVGVGAASSASAVGSGGSSSGSGALARVNIACSAGRNVTSFVGSCGCFGTWSAGYRIGEVVLDAAAKPPFALPAGRGSSLLVVPVRGTPAQSPAAPFLTGIVDICASFCAVCSDALDKVGCPASERVINACGASNNCNGTSVPYTESLRGSVLAGRPDQWVGACACGALDVGNRVAEWLWEATVQTELQAYAYVPPPVDPFKLITNSNPFRPLLAPGYPPPGSAGL